MPLEVFKIVCTCDHFASNKDLVMFLKPVVDALVRLEHATTSLSDIWKESLINFLSLRRIDVLVWPRYIDFKINVSCILISNLKYTTSLYIFLHYFSVLILVEFLYQGIIQ